MKVETQTTGPTITLVTPSDKQTVTLEVCETVKNYYTFEITKDELFECDFCPEQFVLQNADRLVENGSEIHDTNIEADGDLYDQWLAEYEGEEQV